MLDDRTGAIDRFSAPLYTVGEAGRYLGVPTSTVRSWLYGYRTVSHGRDVIGAPVLTALAEPGSRSAVIPFVGLAEAMVLTAMRRARVSLQRIRPALARLQDEVGIAHALASRRLYTDGVEALYDYAEHGPDEGAATAARELVVVRNGQHVFNEIVETYLRRLSFAEDGYVSLIRLPAYQVADVMVDPARGFGQPIFERGGARLEDALSLFKSGEPLEVVADEYGVPLDQLEDVVRVALPAAA